MALSTGERIGPYKTLTLIGEGGMGEVYHALDTKLNRPVAIKLLSDRLANPDARRRFQLEAQTASSLNHPHIITVHDVGEFGGRQYLVTEYIDGGTLRDWSLVTKSGYGKLADFGLAKLEERIAPEDETRTLNEGITRPGVVVGTVAYMSPEQVSGQRMDARSDVFSFGVMLYEILDGKRPFCGTSELEVLQSIRHASPEPFRNEVPAAVRAVVYKALEKNPGDRYQSMREMVVDFRRLLRQADSPSGR